MCLSGILVILVSKYRWEVEVPPDVVSLRGKYSLVYFYCFVVYIMSTKLTQVVIPMSMPCPCQRHNHVTKNILC